MKTSKVERSAAGSLAFRLPSGGCGAAGLEGFSEDPFSKDVSVAGDIADDAVV